MAGSDQVNMGVYLPRHLREGFRDFCRANGTSMKVVIEKFIRALLACHGVDVGGEDSQVGGDSGGGIMGQPSSTQGRPTR